MPRWCAISWSAVRVWIRTPALTWQENRLEGTKLLIEGKYLQGDPEQLAKLSEYNRPANAKIDVDSLKRLQTDVRCHIPFRGHSHRFQSLDVLICSRGDGIAAVVLREAGLDADIVKAALSRGPQEGVADTAEETDLKELLTQTVPSIARDLGTYYVGTGDDRHLITKYKLRPAITEV